MNKPQRVAAISVALISLGMASSADAALVSRLGGLAYYDDVADLTWLADANYAETSRWFDDSGRMTWATANQWAADLVVGGNDNWRLPTVTDTGTSGCDYSFTGTDCGYNVDTTTGEMASMFYDTLGNLGYYDTSGNRNQSGWGLTNTGPFSNLQSDYYWSSTEYAPFTSSAWIFIMDLGVQEPFIKPYNYYAWAVQSGDVGAVPVPAAVWLFGSGLIGLIAVARRKKV